MAKRGVIVVLVLGILLASFANFVSAQEPGAAFDALNFINAYISDVKGKVYDPNGPSQTKLSDLWLQCRDYCFKQYDTSGKSGSCDESGRHCKGEYYDILIKYQTCVHRCNVRQEKAKILPELALCEKIKNEAQNKNFDVLMGYVTDSLKTYLSYTITPYEIYSYYSYSKGYYSSGKAVPMQDYPPLTEETFKTYLDTIGLPEDGTLGYQGGEVDPTSSFNYDLYRQKLIDEIKDKVSVCESQLKEFTDDVRTAGGSGQVSKDEEDLCAPCEKIESREAKEECYYECQKEDIQQDYALEDEPTITGVPSSTDQETSEDGNYEKGGTLKEWKERLQSETGPDSEQSKTAAACDELMKQKTAECSQHGGWRTDYMMEITDFRTDEHYELQDIRNGGCPATSPTGDTTYLDSQAKGGKSEYQVVCSVLCSSWSCDVPIGTEVGGIESLKGKVEVMQPDGSWKEVKLGTKVYLNDNIRTGKDSKAVIKLADDTVFTIGQDSSLAIDEFVYDPNTNIGKLTASLSKGVFRLVTGKMIHRDTTAITINTPIDAIGIRGTDFILSYDPDTKTSVMHLYEGKVDITLASTGDKKELDAGQTVTIEDTAINDSLPLSQEKWISLVDETRLAEESSSSFFVNSVILIILIVGAVLIIRKIKKRKDSKTIKKQSIGHKKPGKSFGETKKWGIASLILAILSILFIILPYFGIILAILAVVFARIQKKHNPTRIATAGLVIGIIGIVLNILVLIAIVQ